jgi:thioredoxin 1
LAIDLNRDNYEDETLKSAEPVMVDFWGPACGPCLALNPAVNQMEKDYTGKLKVARVNAAENRMLCAKLRVLGLPTFVFYKNGAEFKRIMGKVVGEAEVRQILKEML